MEKSAAEEVLGDKVTIKEEVLNDDIKEFAETAMNELLGWYGYGNNHSRDLGRDALPSRSHSGSNSSGQESPKFGGSCRWCGKTVDENTALSSAAATFCSELCFSQSRRANFKKNKTCDWCRHVRHTVSYVDSQDGSSQLQFCSDKCINQYKMHIFWRETRAHLELHPHLHGEESTSGTLITPDLWMAKCKSPDRRTSPTPSLSPKPADNSEQTSPLPLITVAHPSKLMAQELFECKNKRNKFQKKNKKKSPSLPTVCVNIPKISHPDGPQDLRIRHTPTDFENTRLNSEQNAAKVNPLRTEPPSIQQRINPPLLRSSHSHYFSNVEETAHKKLLDGFLPPPTVLVPYPLILPLPIPIPIPIPFPVSSTLNDKSKTNTNNNEVMFKETSSQTEELCNLQTEISTNQQDEQSVSKKIAPSRPMRKRKRNIEKKTKVPIKNKKMSS